MLRAFLTILLCLAALSAQARCKGTDTRPFLTDSQRTSLQREVDKVPYNRGNHWIATRGNQTIHIVGTMHINDRRLNAVMHVLKPVIRRADVILVEVSKRDEDRFWQTAKEHQSLFFLSKGPDVQDLMSEAAWKTLTQAADAQRMDLTEIAKLKPWILSMLLTGSNCGPGGLFASNGLDSRIEKQARRRKIPVGSLETVDSAIRLLSRQPLNDQVLMLQFDLLQSASNDHGFITTREAYFDEKLAEAMILERWRFDREFPGSKATRARLWQSHQNDLLTQRNKNWMPIILRTKGELLIVAVGAAHLPGHEGVLNLLHKAGFKMQRAAF